MADVPDGVFEHGASPGNGGRREGEGGGKGKGDDPGAGWELLQSAIHNIVRFAEEVVCACGEEDGGVERDAGGYGGG